MSSKEELAQRVKTFREHLGSVSWMLNADYVGSYLDDLNNVVQNTCVLMLTLWDQLRSDAGLDRIQVCELKRWCNTLGLVPVDRLFVSLGIAKDALLEYVESGRTADFRYSTFKGRIKAAGGVVSFIMPVQPLLTALEGSSDSFELFFSDVYQALSFAERFCPFKCEPVAFGTQFPNNPLIKDAIVNFVTVDVGLDSVTNYPADVAKAISELLQDWLGSEPLPTESFGFSAGATEEVPRRRSHPLEKAKYLYLTEWDVALVNKLTCDDVTDIVKVLANTTNCNTGELYPSRYSVVPKSAKAFRGITLERTGLSWVQQGVGRSLVAHIHRCRLTRGHVNLEHAELGRINAQLGSQNDISVPIDRSMVTVDLKAASDSVSWEAVRHALLDAGLYLAEETLRMCRSTHIAIPIQGPDGRASEFVHRLRKFAGMGNRLTFPLEVVVFVSCCIAAIRRHGDNPRNSKFIVYGDDISIERKYYATLCEILAQCGFTVNADKSFAGVTWPRFRESCGGHFLDGRDVTPVRLGRPWRVSRITSATKPDDIDYERAPTEFEQLVDLANRAYMAGLRELRAVILWEIRERFPESKLPCCTTDGRMGLISPNPTNYHLARKGPYVGPLVREEVHRPVSARFRPYHHHGWTRLDFQDEAYGDYRCGVVTTSFDFRYDRLGPNEAHIHNAPLKPGDAVTPSEEIKKKGVARCRVANGIDKTGVGFPEEFLQETLRMMELRRTSARIGYVRELVSILRGPLAVLGELPSYEAFLSRFERPSAEIDGETIGLSIGHTPVARITTKRVSLPESSLGELRYDP